MSAVPFEVNIDPEKLQEALIQSLLNTSDFGRSLKAMIEKAVKDNWGKQAEHVIVEVFNTVLRETVAVTIRNEYTDQITEAVRHTLTDDYIRRMAASMLDKTTGVNSR